ncbi:hypothetical protein SAMN02910265_02797 [Ruminococcus flavefaciens]|uniref:Lipoprotein n=1 Tax=Ruminococcus flavefaciens TaxID=1265 RepID=A0A1H6KWS3_RUMFL|nr:hypothetical protein [Ruminococcus flavefaciens]SEH80382.1 hypothetical protein SAMN02910265_02797 [Ruminococcus flavefaciens]
MKKALFITVLTTVSLGLIGCEAVNTANRSAMSSITATVTTSAESDSAPVKTETAAVSEASDEAAVPMKNSISTDTDNTADWKTAYKKTLTEFMDSDNYGEMSTWDIQDIDNDGTPELLISEAQQHIKGVMFYYYENGNAVPVLDDNRNPLRYGVYGGVLICPEESLIGITDVKQGLNYSVMHKYENHRITFVQRTLEDSGTVGKENVTYTVNDDTVGEEEYNIALDEFSSKNWTAVGNQYTFDDLSALD